MQTQVAEVTSNGLRDDNPSPLKKRKIRKGTISCWECKRRKIRCTFTSAAVSVSDGCKSRRLKCVSQEFQDSNVAVPKSKTDRLDRVESLIEKLSKHAQAGTTESLVLPRQDGLKAHDATVRRQDKETSSINSSNLVNSNPHTAPSLEVQLRGQHDEISQALFAIWPDQNELEIMLSAPVGLSMLYHGVVYISFSSLLKKDMPSPKDMLQSSPPPGSHPVLMARKLLTLGIFLQGIPPDPAKKLPVSNLNYQYTMSHIVETVKRLVTDNDDLLGSLEGIECLMIQSMYQNNSGNLRQAWLTNRRAIAIAQMMGLHKDDCSKPPKMLEAETQHRINLNYMWFRLICSDRYLSLILGLPQTCRENPFAKPKALANCTPLERLERIESVAGGLVLERNDIDIHDLPRTQEIDKLLQDAEASMPAQWWLTPDPNSIVGDSSEAFTETTRMMIQFAHHHILIQLHLPYLLLPPTDRKYDNSKITAVNSSREALARFLSFQGFDTIANYYCRGVDFIIFIASTTLCMAHIDACRQRRAENNNGAMVAAFLAHQHSTDRGMMERTLESMEKKAQSGDVVARRIAGILKCLLDIEAAAASGDCYSTSVVHNVDEAPQCSDDMGDGSNMLQIYLPSFGTVKIEKSCNMRYNAGYHSASQADSNATTGLKVSDSGSRMGQYSDPSMGAPQPSNDSETLNFDASLAEELNLLVPELTTGVDDWALQGVDMALFENLFRGSLEPF